MIGSLAFSNEGAPHRHRHRPPIMISVVLLVSALQAAPQQQGGTWSLGGTPNAGYTTVSTAGSVMEKGGATIALRSSTAAPAAFGAISTTIPADSFRTRRIRVSADIDAVGAVGGASPWVRVDAGTAMLALENGSDAPVKGTTTARRDLVIYVPPSATRVIVGLIVYGPGEATARGLRIDALPAVPVNAPLSPQAQVEIDSALSLVRRNSLWRDTVSWGPVESDVRAMAAGSQTAADAFPAIRELLRRLGDHHSFLMKPSGAQAFRTGGAENPRPVVKLLPAGVGYVSVPAYGGAEQKAMRDYAEGMHDSLAAIVSRAGCHWVVDLRGNGGGNMWPMLGGLRPFLGEVGLGSFVSAAGSAPLWHANAVDVPPPPSLTGLDSAYVALLTGPRTASSGEAVTISFRGRPRTRSFGLATAGLSTANQGYALPDGSMIFLTVSVEADRTGKRYGEKIEPDEVIPAPAPGSSDDTQLARAVAWLGAQTCGG